MASAIGEPIGADELTSKLEILPFAKLCVEYKVGNDLPDKIEVETLIPGTDIKKVETVSVQYPFKPLVCSACKSLGHIVGACPFATRSWVMKENQKASVTAKPDVTQVEPTVDMAPTPNHITEDKTVEAVEVVARQPPDSAIVSGLLSPLPAVPQKTQDEEGWTTVPCKRNASCSPSGEVSPSTPCNFRSLKQVDEIDKKMGQATAKLTKSARKKLKKSLGSGASQISS